MARGTLAFSLVTLVACGTTNPGGGNSAFKIELRFGSSVSDAYKLVFNNAANRWKEIITANLGNLPTGTFDPADCNVSGFPSPATVSNDLTIYAVVEPIDGVGNVLGSAGPCITRQSNDLTIVGSMRFDIADVDALANAGQLQETITHEMGHVLGIGTLWKTKGLLTGAGSNGQCGNTPEFTGTNAVNEWKALGGTGNVPVEGAFDKNGNPIGQGTCEGHWRESVFTNELLTGFLDDGKVNPLSRLTIASVKDLGYTVNLNAAQAYTLDNSPLATRLKAKKTKLEMKLLEPRFQWQ